jgi:hypothetical protein
MRLCSRRNRIVFVIAFAWVLSCFFSTVEGRCGNPTDVVATFLSANCIDCHNGSDVEAGLDLEDATFSAEELGRDSAQADLLEKVLRRINARQMPPPEYGDRPDERDYVEVASAMAKMLAENFEASPRAGDVSAIHRLTRTEYQNAVRDLVGVQIDASTFLPKDESSHGFDNITATDLSPTLINRYLAAAEKISQSAIGASSVVIGTNVRVAADRTQEAHVQGLPFATRGGVTFEHQFSQSGEYEIAVKLTRDRDEKVEGLNRKHDLDILIDRHRVHRFTVSPPSSPAKGAGHYRDFGKVDSHLVHRVHVDAGPHQVGVTFPKENLSLRETKRKPFDASFNRHRHPRRSPAIFQVSVVGPFGAVGPEDTPSRRMIFGNDYRPEKIAALSPEQQKQAAHRMIARLARRAYRKPVADEDVLPLLEFYHQGVQDARSLGGKLNEFEAGMEMALTALLVNPNFLLKIESGQGATGQPKSVYRISDLELATRLSFFLWSSLPDETLLKLAEEGRLSDPPTLKQQVERMLSDRRSESLATNFADQWLQLRNLKGITPNLRSYPDFDDNLRTAFREETLRLFSAVKENNLSVLKLIRPGFTFLNQRLATHYEMNDVLGSHFRRVELPDDSQRGGILRHGSVLMVTSYATRTSPTIRGNWILENILGTPAPPPPANVANLKDKSDLVATTVRQRLAQHRQDPACAGCHNLMDPVGFSLENFDVVGRWRDYEDSLRVDASGRLPDGHVVQRPADLEAGILKRPEVFVATLAEKMMTFALGRGVEPFDGPAIRKIVSESIGQPQPKVAIVKQQENYRFNDIVTGIVLSQPFHLRSSQ